MHRNRALILSALAVLVATLALVPQASALSCARDCSGDCGGGCTVASIECSAACIGGACPGKVECYEYGGSVTACTASFSHDCKASGGPGGPETQFLQVPKQSEWAVLKYRTDEVHPVNSTQVNLVAASTPRFGGLAVEKFVRSSQESYKRRVELRQEATSRGDTVKAPPSENLFVRERVHFSVDLGGACLGVKLVIPQETPAPEIRGSGFFRVIADANGEITAVAPLYLEPGTQVEALSRFLREQGRLLTDAGSPVETFIYLRAEDVGVSYITGSASRWF